MSRIRRLHIRGIRNFGDESDNTQIIHFARPLTLISGPNGTGKTTIIESLKYATTGDFPPGSSGGKAFVHDPTIAKSSSVKGVVKAEIVDTRGDNLTISRTIVATKHESLIRLKTLDNTISRRDKVTNEHVMISNRCADITIEIVRAMGVSKPILNYVIFCHQEDFNWPLDEAKKLKERFDDIFDTTKFNKALEGIRKYCKDSQGEFRVLKAEQDAFKTVLAEAKAKEKTLDDFKKRYERSKADVEGIEKDLEPVEKKIIDIRNTQVQYDKTKLEEEKKKMEFDVIKQQIQDLKENINIFEGTTEDINKELAAYYGILRKKDEEIQELEKSLEHVTKEETDLAKDLVNARLLVGTLRQQVKDHEKRIVNRNKLLNNALKSWNMNTVEADVSEIEVIALAKRLKERMCEMERSVEEKKAEQDQEEKQFQSKIDELRSAKSKIESEVAMREGEISNTRQEIDRIRSQISQTGAASKKLNDIEQKLKVADTNIDMLNKSLDTEEVKEKIKDKSKKIDNLTVTLKRVEKEVTSLQQQTSLQTELELQKSTLNSKEKEIDNLRKKHETNLKVVFGNKEFPQRKIKAAVEETQRILADQIQNLNQELQTEQCCMTTLQTTISHTEKELEKKLADLESDKGKISLECYYKDFDETLLLVSKKVKDLQDRRGLHAYQELTYKEYLQQLKERDPCCPLCHREFQGQYKAQDLIKELETEIKRHPDRLKTYDTELKKQQHRYDTMLQLKPVVEKVLFVEGVELKKFRQSLEDTKIRFQRSKKKVEQLQTSMSEPEKKIALCKNMIGDMALWDRYVDEIVELGCTIATLKKRMSDAGVKSDRSIQETQTEQEFLKGKLRDYQESLETLRNSLNSHNEKLHRAREAKNTLKEEQLRIQSDMQKLKQLRDKQEELYTREISLGEMIQELKQKLVIANEKLETAVRHLEKSKKEHWDKQEHNRNSVTEAKRQLYELHAIQNEINNFIQREITEKLANTECQVAESEALSEKLKVEKGSFERKIACIKDDASRHELRKRELVDNLTLRQKQDQSNVIRQQYLELKEKLRSMNPEQLKREVKKLIDLQEALQREKNIVMGKQEELERNIKQLQLELMKQSYRLARTNYRNKCYELTIQEQIIQNLNEYTRVLDSAMIEYHEERMQTLNSILKRLWNMVYRGTDTASIQIRTEATGGMGAKRRTYTYKLVQEKHGVEMDMRGRCSAGQGVLASIILRIALAETFCKDCGILALDEPTTNLDEENANSLADALAAVVKIRSQYQKNFQLIVISHDEKFLSKLAQLNSNKEFYRLYRSADGLTGIEHCTIEERSTQSHNQIGNDSSDNEIKDEPISKHGLSASDEQQPGPSRKKRQIWDDAEYSHRSTKKRIVLDI
ncbi:DNA repair protein RAD50 [Orussus abietinus]|uniref:DNA repair protein RAD50 n=1 Tax=Orussus abietinus TaxID=222816 RepID=UPI000626133E|nr:DNA repair protein RAD50 [Orussus abietinus]